jgi:pantoate--beta-alanine ligase
MSSRNAYLAGVDRSRALALSRALRSVDDAWRQGERDARLLEKTGQSVLSATPGVIADYFAVVAPETLAPVDQADAGAIVIVAAKVGATRLIDNLILGQNRMAAAAAAEASAP